MTNSVSYTCELQFWTLTVHVLPPEEAVALKLLISVICNGKSLLISLRMVNEFLRVRKLASNIWERELLLFSNPCPVQGWE